MLCRERALKTSLIAAVWFLGLIGLNPVFKVPKSGYSIMNRQCVPSEQSVHTAGVDYGWICNSNYLFSFFSAVIEIS